VYNVHLVTSSSCHKQTIWWQQSCISRTPALTPQVPCGLWPSLVFWMWVPARLLWLGGACVLQWSCFPLGARFKRRNAQKKTQPALTTPHVYQVEKVATWVLCVYSIEAVKRYSLVGVGRSGPSDLLSFLGFTQRMARTWPACCFSVSARASATWDNFAACKRCM